MLLNFPHGLKIGDIVYHASGGSVQFGRAIKATKHHVWLRERWQVLVPPGLDYGEAKPVPGEFFDDLVIRCHATRSQKGGRVRVTLGESGAPAKKKSNS